MRRLTTHLDRGLSNLPLAHNRYSAIKNSPPLPQLRAYAADEDRSCCDAVWASEDLKEAWSHSLSLDPVQLSFRAHDVATRWRRVVDFTRVLAGPPAQSLRDLGADVIKLNLRHPTPGEVVPHMGPMSLYFAQQNAGKQALSIDLNFPEAQEIVKKLVEERT